jgi:AcrR family transcriptional regulator
MGRPSRITRTAIVDAALVIGIDDVTMTSVAERLGVSIGALYRHVHNRDELLRLVADAQLRELLAPKDVGQHWAALARAYAAMLFESFAGQPGLILEYANGGFPPESEVDGIERYLEAMHLRGFTAAEAVSLMRDMRAVALGAAFVATAMRSVDARIGADAAIDAAFAGRGVDELVLLRSASADYRRIVAQPGWEETIDRMLAAVAAERGETLPEGWRG